MTATIKNLIEVQEQDANYGQALLLRRKNIARFSALGPPDLCYLTKVQSKSFGRSNTSTKTGYFHYAYGVDMSSPACISIYINNLLKNQEVENKWFSSNSVSIRKAIYCVYDAFRKVDVRAEFSIPGGMRLYAISKNEQSIAIDGSEWDSVYISAVLRAFNPEQIPFTRFYRELATKDQLKDFLLAVANFATKRDLEFESDEILNYRGNRLLHSVNSYLIRKRRLGLAMDFFAELTKSDKRCAAFMVDIFSCMYRYPESVKLLAPVLQKNPHISVLLYQEVESLMKMEKYEMALKLAKVVIQLCPESFDAWYQLAEIFFYSKHFSEALIAINTCPFYTKPNHNDGITRAKPNQVVKPKLQDLCSSYTQFMFEPSYDIYTPTHLNEEVAKLSNNFVEESEAMIQSIKNLPAASFTANELKVYKLLVKIERELGWEALLKLRTSIFIMDSDLLSKSNNRDHDISRIEDYNISDDEGSNREKHEVNFAPGLSMNEQSFHMVKLGGETYVDKYREDLETLDSVRPDDMPSFLKDDIESFRDKKGGRTAYHKGSGAGTSEASRLEETAKDEEEDDLTRKYRRFLGGEARYSTGTKFDPLKIINLESNSKRLCSHTLEQYFIALHEDLNLFYEWQHEDNQSRATIHGDGTVTDREQDDEKLRYSGLVWVYRGILAERLCRISFAEKAYRKVIDKAISLYALARLYKLYLESDSIKAALLCFAEIIEELEVEGVQTFDFLPNWLEEPMLQLISNIGLTKLKIHLKEANLLNDKAISIIIKQAEFWGIENTD